MKECKTHGYIDSCPICALEKRVKLLELFIEGPCLILRQARFDEQVNKAFGLPTVPRAEAAKFYSGFTADEWQQMLKDGPLLCDGGSGNFWVDGFHPEQDESFSSGTGVHTIWWAQAKLIEQPNWRPYMINEYPVPGRVRVEVECQNGKRYTSTAEGFHPCRWKRGAEGTGIRAYRILGA